MTPVEKKSRRAHETRAVHSTITAAPMAEPPTTVTDDTHDAAAMVRHAHVAKPAPTETDAHDAAAAVVIHACLTSFVEAHSAVDLDAVMYVGVEIEPREPPS